MTIDDPDETLNDYKNMFEVTQLYFALYTAALTGNDLEVNYCNQLLAATEKEKGEPISLTNFFAGKKEIYHIYVEDIVSGAGQIFALEGFFKLYPRANFESNVVLLIKDGFAHTEICRAFKFLFPNNPVVNLLKSEVDAAAIIQKYYKQPPKEIQDPDYGLLLEWEGTKHYVTSIARLYTAYSECRIKDITARYTNIS